MIFAGPKNCYQGPPVNACYYQDYTKNWCLTILSNYLMVAARILRFRRKELYFTGRVCEQNITMINKCNICFKILRTKCLLINNCSEVVWEVPKIYKIHIISLLYPFRIANKKIAFKGNKEMHADTVEFISKIKINLRYVYEQRTWCTISVRQIKFWVYEKFEEH